MAVKGVKPNKCFGAVLYPKFSGTGSVTIPANASGSRSILFSDANISIGDNALVTMQGDAGTLAALGSGLITIRHAITNGSLVVYVFNTDSMDHTVTVNVAVV